ncbi:MAG: glycerol acyltransferase [Chlorobiota bacterium]
MPQIDLRSIIESKAPGLLNRYPSIVVDPIIFFLNKVLYLNPINSFLEKNPDLRGIDFIDELFDHLDFSYVVSKKEKDRIPSEGRVIIVANHPLGGLDGLALIKLVSEVRSDVRIVVNDVLSGIDNLNELFLPIDIHQARLQSANLTRILSALNSESAVIIFPAGEVSRLTTKGIRDRAWNKGVLLFAKMSKADILPVYVKGRNSFFFYLFSLIWKNFSMFLLPGEMLRKKGMNISFRIGEPISTSAIFNGIDKPKHQIKLLRKHVQQIGNGGSGIYKTSRPIVQPMPVKLIRKKLMRSELIMKTPDDKHLFLVEPEDNYVILQEIARLREITFRRVGEGTGTKSDIDKYDRHYSHLVLWDNAESEIIGSYRIGLCRHLIRLNGIDGLYTSTLFEFSDKFKQYLPDSIELGRSFIQAKYWNTNALDLLWQGLGSYLSVKPHIKYLFGGVSISSTFPTEATAMMVWFFRKWFGSSDELAVSKNRFSVPDKLEEQFRQKFDSTDYTSDLKTLKFSLRHFNVSIPPLLKHYSNLCDDDGVKFLDFGIDPDFANCIDGLILVEVDKIKSEKKARYFKEKPIEKVA